MPLINKKPQPINSDVISLSKILASNEHLGFRIPIYQRHYDWDNKNVNRLFETVVRGFFDLLNPPCDKQSAIGTNNSQDTFLGTTILVEEHNTEGFFLGESYSIVDGQQRLTTISLIIGELRYSLWKLRNEIEQSSATKPLILEQELLDIEDSLFKCNLLKLPDLSGSENDFPYAPRIIRQDDDERKAPPPNGKHYTSNIGLYLFELGLFISKNSINGTFDAEKELRTSMLDYKAITKNIVAIRKCLGHIEEGNFSLLDIGYEYEISMVDLINKSNSLNLFTQKHKEKYIHEIKRYTNGITKLVRLMSFSKYLLDKVQLNAVVVNSNMESIAFDIFESLNSTGEPLTSIQILKPIVAKRIGDAYQTSKEKSNLEYIDTFLEKNNSSGKNTSAELVISFLYYLTGEKIPAHLNVQRRKIIDLYRHQLINSLLFTESLKHVAQYVDNFWFADKPEEHLGLKSSEDLDLAVLCLQFIKDMKHKMTIPILARYWRASVVGDDPNLFLGAIKAVTAFIVIRRSMTPNTAGIDDDFRNILHSSKSHKVRVCHPLSILDSSLQKRDIVELSELKRYLMESLMAANSSGKNSIAGKEEWLGYSKKQDVYTNKALCRFLLLCSADGSKISNTNKLKLISARISRRKDLLSCELWNDLLYKTIEHVAPQSNQGSGWDGGIYKDGLHNSIGNLTLLAKNANSYIDNKSWVVKKHIYELFLEETKTKFDNKKKKLQARGINVINNIEYNEKIKCDERLLGTIANHKLWDKQAILKRSENILSRVWDRVAPWIDL